MEAGHEIIFAMFLPNIEDEQVLSTTLRVLDIQYLKELWDHDKDEDIAKVCDIAKMFPNVHNRWINESFHET